MHVTTSKPAVLELQWPQPLVRQQDVHQLLSFCSHSCWAARRCAWSRRSRPSTTAGCSGTLPAGLTRSGSTPLQVCSTPSCCSQTAVQNCSSCPLLRLIPGSRYCGDAFVPPLPLCCHAFRLCITFHPCEGVAKPSLSASVTSAQLQIGTPRPGAAPAPARGRLCCVAQRHLSATTRPCGALMVRMTPKTPPNQTPACAAQCRLCGCQSNLNSQQQASLTSVPLILLQATARSLAPRAVSKTTRLQRESRRTKQTRPRKLLPQICRCACRLKSSFFLSLNSTL